MDANVPYQIIQYASAKNQNGYISPDNYNLIINNAQRQYEDYLIGEYQKYQAGRPIAVVEFGQNEKVRQSLSPLIYSAILSPNTTTGIAAYPSDFELVDAMWGVYNFNRIRFVQQDSLDSYYNSVIDPIATNPIYLLKHEGFQFYPVNIGIARMSYIRDAPGIVWGYDEIDGDPVYNASKSTAPVWGEFDMYNIIVRALAIAGVNLQLNTVIAYANDINKGGQ